MKKTLVSIALLLILAGCGPAIKHTLSPEYGQISPKKVVVLPVVWEKKSVQETDAISLLFRKMSSEKLFGLNYYPIPLEEVDRAGAGKPDWFVGKPVHEIAALLNADSVLFIRVTDWDKDDFTPYKSLEIAASFELASALGKSLWKAEYSTNEADLGLDSRSMELAVQKTFEPRIQRFVDAVFTTLPPGEAKSGQRKTYFQWLP
ncbi:MAG: hypothetical protein IT362_03695 [Deltaproteobacteria bacterium]|nr:hypothetical protein [Deltaproteobacteria bacterium]